MAPDAAKRKIGLSPALPAGPSNLCIGLVWMAALTGCVQSGHITNVCTSADGWVLAFEDDMYRTIWVADRSSIRCVARGTGDALALSPDGRYLLSVTHSESRRRCTGFLGDRFELLDLKTRRRWRGTGPWPTDVGEFEALLHFEPDGAFSLAIVPQPDSFTSKKWAASRPAEICWRWTPAKGFESAPGPPDHGIRFGWSTAGFDSELMAIVPIDYVAIVPIDYDGWNARRQVWVRPDGSTMEICRQNDLPLTIPLCIITMPTFIINFFWLDLPLYVVQSFTVVWEPKEQLAEIAELVSQRKAAAKQP